MCLELQSLSSFCQIKVLHSSWNEMCVLLAFISSFSSSSYFCSLYSICVSEAKCSFVMYRTSSSCIPCVIPSVPFFVMSYHPSLPSSFSFHSIASFFVSLVSSVRKRDKRVVLSSFFYFMYTLLAFDRVKCSLMDVFSSHPLRHHESATHISSWCLLIRPLFFLALLSFTWISLFFFHVMSLSSSLDLLLFLFLLLPLLPYPCLPHLFVNRLGMTDEARVVPACAKSHLLMLSISGIFISSFFSIYVFHPRIKVKEGHKFQQRSNNSSKSSVCISSILKTQGMRRERKKVYRIREEKKDKDDQPSEEKMWSKWCKRWERVRILKNTCLSFPRSLLCLEKEIEEFHSRK